MTKTDEENNATDQADNDGSQKRKKADEALADQDDVDAVTSAQNFNPKYAGKLKPSVQAMFPNYHSPDEEMSKKVEHHRQFGTSGTPRVVRDLLTIMALSFHSLFEGLAIGIEDSADDVWTLFLAIAIHKLVIIFCIGVELVTAGTSVAFFTLYMVTFALMSPLGVAIGIGIAEGSPGLDQENHFLVVGLLQALSAGTILYVVVFEVLQREKAKSVSGLLQLGFVLLGFSAMLALELFGGHMHGGNGHGHDHLPLLPSNQTSNELEQDHLHHPAIHFHNHDHDDIVAHDDEDDPVEVALNETESQGAPDENISLVAGQDLEVKTD